MSATEERLLEPPYSSIFLSFMAHTDKIRLRMPPAKPACRCHGGGPGNNPPVTILATSVNTTANKPEINKTQTVIVARALKIGGISFSFLVLFYASIITLAVK